jgi:iron complex transport system permease protein
MALRLAALFAVALFAAGIGLLVGGTQLSVGQVAHALTHAHEGGPVATIVWQLRLPRVCIAAVVGACLAVAGALLQGMLRNPIVDPYITGVSAGAATAIVLAVIAGVSPAIAPSLGFVAGLATAVFVAALARRGSGIDVNRLILAGISLSALFSAFLSLALARAQSENYAASIVSWLAGSMAGRTWSDLLAATPYVALGMIGAASVAPALNALRVGDVRARAVGVDVARAQWVILGSSSLLAAASVALAGIVGFVGLIVPHVARRVVGSDARPLLPACAFAGAALCILADAVARTIVAPGELPIGVLLAFIGVPAFLYLYLNRERAA